MTIEHGYCTLADLKERLLNARHYTAGTLSFDAATRKIQDAALKLKRFPTGAILEVSGSAANDGSYTIATGSTPGEIVVAEALVNEAVTNPATLVTLTDISDTFDDEVLEQVIEAVSREIEAFKKRRFWTTDKDEERYFTAADGGVVYTDDLLSVTSLSTDEADNRTYTTSWEAADYDLAPANAALKDRPYTRIEARGNGRRSFPLSKRGVKVVGKFGYSATTPSVVREACLLQAERLFKRKEAPLGVMGTPETGYVRLKAELDPDVVRLLDGLGKARL